MDDQTPTTPPERTPETGELEPIVPDPHRGEPTPPAQEGLRPEADAEIVRPVEDEPNGPLTGLVAASGAEVEAEYTDDAGAEELLAMMGVEDEGIEAGQIGGLALATLVSIGALAVVMYYLFYSPTLDKTVGIAEGEVRYEELEIITTEGETKLTQYARADSAYTLPIDAAMAVVAAEYADGVAPDAPRTRAAFNTAPLPALGMTASRLPLSDDAMQDLGGVAADTVATAAGDVGVPLDDGMEEQVGVDVPEDPDPAGSGL